ncbi:hypothetical protein ONZ45_g17203 [Pleurotus djamor]|nr:hypothetical protein ONZ45_g17203 [Pleurotus djamor]
MADRATKLNKFLNDVVRGQRQLTTLSQRDLFFEAFLAQGDVMQCLTLICTSKEGLPSLQKAVRFDLSDRFLDSDTLSNVLSRLQQRGIEHIDSGKFLSKILESIVEPPIFWNAFVAAFRSRQLRIPAQKCFAWILLQLITLSGSPKPTYISLAEDPQIIDFLTKSEDADLRAYGYNMKNIVASPDVPQGVYRPGGRHDNDFADYRAISILPTADEILSTEIPFLRLRQDLEDPSTLDKRAAIYLDNQFRLLREDMLSELKEEIQIASGKKKGKSRGFSAKGLQLVGVHCDPDARRNDKWGILMKLGEDLPQMAQQKLRSPQSRKDFWKHQRRLLAHQSTVCLFGDGNIIGFASVNRDEDKLSQNPPVLLLHPQGLDTMTDNLLSRIQTCSVVSIMQINTAVFAFEPILRAIQKMRKVPLEEEILLWDDLSDLIPPSSMPSSLVNSLHSNPSRDLKSIMTLPKSIKLDPSQAKSLLAGLTQRLSIIQGPPGTGKSFIGALLAKIIHDFTSQRILVVCYTNHALDQFLEDLLDIGIPLSSMVRLGGKSTSRTEPMSLFRQDSAQTMARDDYLTLDRLRQTLPVANKDLRDAFTRYQQSKVSNKDILNHIEFEESDFSEAFYIPVAKDGSIIVGRNGRPIHETYLLERWIRGENAGVLVHANPLHVSAAAKVWDMPMPLRIQKRGQWEEAIMRDRVSEVTRHARLYNSTRDEMDRILGKKDVAVLKEKQVIGCTTTAAAKYAPALQAAAPNVLLVEEAGEILESHVLAALGKHKEQVILIGDHKQLRPKVNNYMLTVEKGEGYDLNMSLFERLVIKGYPHQTLNQQHRMRPEISSLVRELTYPDLVDAPKTQNRPDVRGLRDNVVLINHDKPEDDIPDVADRFATSSKQNSFEVDLVIHIVRYLAQQGYGTDSMVVLTPYLGQLNLFFRRLKNDTDPILNDLDSYDLVRAGLMTPASAKVNKSSLRLATIDNYQGEEADIVVISLTRSNSSHDIGFMFSPERLNVLLSRARLGLIMVGNTTTFSSSKKGGEIWGKLFDLLRKAGHVYEGLPVQCERHPSRTATLKNAKDFQDLCPDGGCPEACGTMLNCGVHSCPSKCHQIVDHSKMECTQTASSICPKGHRRAYKCSQGPPASCKKCDQDAKRQQEKDRREYEAQKKKDDEQLAHNQRMAEIEAKIEAERLRMQDEGLANARADAIRQKEQELWNLKNNTTNAAVKPPAACPAYLSRAALTASFFPHTSVDRVCF